jgi:SET domain-containing protein
MAPMPSPACVPRDSWFSPKIEIRESGIHERGTFAREQIAAGEAVEVWGERAGGETTVLYTNDPEAVESARREGKVVMQWDDDLFSIEDKGADDGYFLNHSCDANLGFEDAFTLIARRDIAPGDEVTLDYALFEANEAFLAEWRCACGAETCRRRVTGRDWRRGDVQARYTGYFTPLLEKRIARLSAQRMLDD